MGRRILVGCISSGTDLEILVHPDLSTEVDFGIRNLSESTKVLVDEFGYDLSVHKTTLCAEDVFITRKPPNASGHMSICAEKQSQHDSTLQVFKEKIRLDVSLDSYEANISGIKTRLDLSAEEKEVLQDRSAICVSRISPFTQVIELGSEEKQQNVTFPFPIQRSAEHTMVPRSNLSYVEYTEPAGSKEWLSARPDCIFPIFLEGGTPVLQNLHYVNLDRLPILDISDSGKLWWIYSHLHTMLDL
jgi:hypothetical protein